MASKKEKMPIDISTSTSRNVQKSNPHFDDWNGMAAGAICRRGPYVLIRFGFTQLPPPPPPSGPWKLRVHDDEYQLSRKIQKGGVPKKGCAKEHSVCRYWKDCAQYSVGYLKCACYRFKQRWAVLCPFVFPILQIVASAIFRSTQHPPPYPPRTSTSAESLEGIFRGCFSSLFLSDAMESQSRVSLWKHFSFSKNNKNVVLVDFVQGTSSPSFAWDFFLFLPTEKNNTEDIIILTCRERMEYKGGAMLYVDWDVTQPSILWFDEC